MNILYIEDNEGDELLVKTIIKSINPSHNLFVFPNGPNALNFLNMFKTKAKFLDFILLDFGLPRMNGIEILEVLKSDEYLKDIPVVGYSASFPIHEEFIKMGALCFLEKKFDPAELESDLRDLLLKIKNYYMNLNGRVKENSLP